MGESGGTNLEIRNQRLECLGFGDKYFFLMETGLGARGGGQTPCSFALWGQARERI